jgi:hypothetical protein
VEWRRSEQTELLAGDFGYCILLRGRSIGKQVSVEAVKVDRGGRPCPGKGFEAQAVAMQQQG